ncbi:cupin domain-containing protein [Geovibrio thiophilus]|uniref:Cupin domain-containing protein n=1 Tax=Geovibrio thiophilus TaxID=139438 RepID=A0A410JWT6_9BACT|nr:carboxymuconolactone decarboxylase family protein [Geovibrio thiophilus]QAR32656.1 cupin domain-containing protein [Geovibrio thiophilus]
MNTFKKNILTLLAAIFCVTAVSEAAAETNKGLNARQKATIPIAAFTATGNMPKLETALKQGMDAGLTVNEVKEILVHTYAYAGFPRALNGINAFMAVLEKRKEQGVNDKTGREAAPMPSGFDKTTYGHNIRNSLAGFDMSKRTTGYSAFTPVIDQFLVDHLFADIFYRDVLSHQERELVTISILAAMAGTEAQLKGHLRISMNVGLDKTKLEDFLAVLRQEVSAESAERAAETLYDLLGADLPANRMKSAKVIRNEKPAKGSVNYFTGSVTVESRFSSEQQDGYQGGIVNFEAGARTAWHTHPLGQTLIVISGHGLVQSEGEAVQEILPGDVVWIPANERHWHGAAPDSPMSHVAISAPLNGSTVQWMEHVNDGQYGY